jgi:hypothetical protein
MSDVIVGVDPHKKSVTIEAIDGQGKKLATGRFGTSTREYKAMLRYIRHQWPHHRWAIEGAHGVGRPLAQRLLADGEREWLTSPRSSPHGCGSLTPGMHGRPTPPMPTRSRLSRYVPRTCGCSDVARFPDRNHFASWTGTAPLDASSGEQIRHRLSRAGNRRLNHVLHMAAIAQIRLDTEGRTYYRRKLSEAKTRKEARRCLKRRLSDMVYRQLVADAQQAEHPDVEAGPGGHSGTSSQSSAADLHTPVIGSSDQPQPGPAIPTLPAPSPRAKTRAGSGYPGRHTLTGTETPLLTQRGTDKTHVHNHHVRRPR